MTDHAKLIASIDKLAESLANRTPWWRSLVGDAVLYAVAAVVLWGFGLDAVDALRWAVAATALAVMAMLPIWIVTWLGVVITTAQLERAIADARAIVGGGE